ncbi:alpha/beta fold hydrolase [Microtetraspora glauca]|uniref:Alpha/beta fold hydrolase n=1 Tax=Microtetraspora glauca TaxID=1996 RepID=A0ABV3G9P7_MICGL
MRGRPWTNLANNLESADRNRYAFGAGRRIRSRPCDPLPATMAAMIKTLCAAVADTLGFDRFAVYGVSGGGPHALAFAARHPDRVTRVASLAALAPRDADGLDRTAGNRAGPALAR